MAEALDVDDEFIFQLQLDEIKKVSNQANEHKVPCNQFQDFLPTEQYQAARSCETDDRDEKNNYSRRFDINEPSNTALTDIPRKETNYNEHLENDQDLNTNYRHLPMLDSMLEQLEPEILESPNSCMEMNGVHRTHNNLSSGVRISHMPPPEQSPTEHIHYNNIKCSNIRQKQLNFVRHNAPDINRKLNTKFNNNGDSRRNLDSLIARQVQSEVDEENAKKLDKDINNQEVQDRLLAKQLQLQADMESAKQMDKHNKKSQKLKQIGLFNQGHNVNIRQKNVNLPDVWSNILPFGMRSEEEEDGRPFQPDINQALLQLRETERQDARPFQPDINQALLQQFARGPELFGTPYQGRHSPFQRNNPLRATRPETNASTGAEYQHRRLARARNIIPTQERGAGFSPYFLQHPLANNGRRSFSGNNFTGDDIDVDGLEYEQILALEEQMGEVDLGLQKSDFKSLPKEVIIDLNQTERTQCAICFEDFRLKDEVRTLSCSHVYHILCIDKWLKVKAVCPICKEEVKGATRENI